MDMSQPRTKWQNKSSSRKIPKDCLHRQNIYFYTATGKDNSVSVCTSKRRFLAADMFKAVKVLHQKSFVIYFP